MKELIAKCVTRNITFSGMMNARYTVQNFFDGTVSMESVKAMANRLNKQLRELENNDLFGEEEDAKTRKDLNMLRLKLDTLVEVYRYKKAAAERAERALQTREENKRKREVIMEVIAEKELGSLKEKSRETLEQMVAELAGDDD